MTATVSDQAGAALLDNTTLVVREATPIADGVLQLVLARDNGASLAPWEPGAHVELRLPSGKLRQYSLCGSPSDLSTYTIAVLLEPEGRGGSVEIHSAETASARLAVEAQRNHFPLLDGPSYLFFAGGIGITPILPMIEQVKRAGKEWHLIYGGRNRKTMAFLDRLGDDIAEGRVTVLPEAEVGRIDVPSALAEANADAAVYCCGPTGLIAAVEDACRAAGRPAPRSERFTAAEPPAEASDQEDTEFVVELRQAGLELTVPADRSILDVVKEVLPDVPYSCEEGWCGSCETIVLDGKPIHRDTVLTPELHDESATMMICVSRCASARLALDL